MRVEPWSCFSKRCCRCCLSAWTQSPFGSSLLVLQYEFSELMGRSSSAGWSSAASYPKATEPALDSLGGTDIATSCADVLPRKSPVEKEELQLESSKMCWPKRTASHSWTQASVDFCSLVMAEKRPKDTLCVPVWAMAERGERDYICVL